MIRIIDFLLNYSYWFHTILLIALMFVSITLYIIKKYILLKMAVFIFFIYCIVFIKDSVILPCLEKAEKISYFQLEEKRYFIDYTMEYAFYRTGMDRVLSYEEYLKEVYNKK